jgi:hypothetical protein
MARSWGLNLTGGHEGSTEVSVRRAGSSKLTRMAAVAACLGFGGMMIFQLLLAIGLPLGKLAWGGEFETLPRRLRIGSLASAGVFLAAAILVLERAGIIRGFGRPKVARIGTWCLVVLFSLSASLNVLQGGIWEKRVVVPVALFLAVLSLVVALGSPG